MIKTTIMLCLSVGNNGNGSWKISENLNFRRKPRSWELIKETPFSKKIQITPRRNRVASNGSLLLKIESVL